jgi:hypothetical protein
MRRMGEKTKWRTNNNIRGTIKESRTRHRGLWGLQLLRREKKNRIRGIRISGRRKHNCQITGNARRKLDRARKTTYMTNCSNFWRQ